MTTNFLLKSLSFSAFLVVSASQGWAGCINPPLSDQAVNQFKANPKALVDASADARVIETMTRDLAGTDASLAADLVHIAEGAPPRFQTAIAAGLAQAAMACSSVDQKAAQLIQQAVAGFQDGQFQASFAAVAGDLSTAATAAAGASAAGSAGSVTITNQNSSPPTGPSFGGGGTLVPLQLTATALSVNTISDNGTTAAEPVSQTR